MKKKGLLISTIVMVVVLIAALTTSTYAWFTTSATSSVDNIEMNVGASSTVYIGMSTDYGKTSASDYYSEQVTFNATTGKLVGGTNTMGSTISTGLSLDVTGGVGSGTEKEENVEGESKKTVYTMDSSYDPSHVLYKGNGETAETLTGIEPARINGGVKGASSASSTTDVIDFNMGIRAAKTDVYGTYGKITITIPDNAKQSQIVGMIAALHVEISVGAENSVKTYSGDIFSVPSTEIHWNSNPANAEDRTYTFYFMIDVIGSSALSTLDTAEVTPFSIKMFISGYDTDCNNSSTGTSATISLEFDGCESGWTAGSNWTQLELT